MKKHFLILFAMVLSFQVNAIRPEREYPRTPALFEIPYEEYKVRTPDHLELNVWEYSIKNTVSTRTVILVGTDAGNMSYFIWQAKALRELGMRVVAFDYRGFGKSSDYNLKAENLFHVEFATDLDSVIKATRTKYPNESIGLLALSMGSYVGLLRSEPIDFYIAEGFYYDPFAVRDRIRDVKGKTVTLPVEARSIPFMNPPIPILLISTNGDPITTTNEAVRFAEMNGARCVELNGEHLWGLSILTDQEPGDLYAAAIDRFLFEKGR